MSPKVLLEITPEQLKAYLAAKERRAQASARKMKLYYEDPVAFINDCVEFPDGKGLTPYQEEVIGSIPEKKRVAQRGCHGNGKTFTSAVLILWFALTRDAAGVDWKCPVTAGAWRQLEQYLFPEVHKVARMLRWDQIGRDPFRRGEFLTLNLNLAYGSAFAVASSNPAFIEGVHADSVFYIFDESKAISDATFDAAEGAFSGATEGREAFALASSTPGPPSGRFYNIHMHKEGFEDWHTRHIKLEEAISAGRVDPEWVEQKKKQWGADSGLFANRVLGEFHQDDEDTVIPLAWIEAAQQRWDDHDFRTDPLAPLDRIGVDVARTGKDRTVIAPIHGWRVEKLLYFDQNSTTKTEREVMIVAGESEAVITVDCDGVGAGPYDHIKQMVGTQRARPFHAAAATDWQDATKQLEFANCVTGEARLVPVGELRRIYRSRYDGPLFRIQMASGDHFTVTPNHNVLTPTGWKAVKDLHLGDHLCDSTLAQRMSETDPEVNGMPPTISELYEAVVANTAAPKRMGAGMVDFHGDTSVGEVQVVTVNSELLSGLPIKRKHSFDDKFVRLLHGEGSLSSYGRSGHSLGMGDVYSFNHDGMFPELAVNGRAQTVVLSRQPARHQDVGLGVIASGHSFVSEDSVNESFPKSIFSTQRLNRITGHIFSDQGFGVKVVAQQESSGFGLASWVDAVFSENSADNASVYPERLAERMERLPTEIPTDHIINIEVCSSHEKPFVYTMETSTGAYRTANIVQRNCRAAAWWSLRQMLNPDNDPTLELPPDDQLSADLCAPKRKETARGKILVESKDDVKKRLEGRSTDAADSVIMPLFNHRKKRRRRMGDMGFGTSADREDNLAV